MPCYLPPSGRRVSVARERLGRVLDRIGEADWERVGLGMGLLACVSIGSQLVHELSSRTPSSLSTAFLLGFALVYGFWFLYGLRFQRVAIWLSNGVAVVLQLLLTAVVILKA
jgi:uncharacterized protein with PQ loop repeat